MSSLTSTWVRAVCFFGFVIATFGLENGLARTPVMGWLAWERFKCNTNCEKDKENCISEQLFMDMADRLVEDGYKDAGYTFVNIDDCYMYPARTASGDLFPDPERFPHGIKFLADYMHSRGLKLGIYQDFGKYTCMGYPGIVGHMEQDAAIFAQWDVDMVKLDGCHSHPADMEKGYTTFGGYLNKTGKAMVYSCSWPYYQLTKGMQPNYQLISEHCNMWRVFDDIQDNWVSIQYIIDFFGDNQEVLTKHVGPGRWSDPDMLVIGNFHLTEKQSQIQMAVWAILAAPLLMSNDLRKMEDKFKNILLNREVIAVDQDPLGIPGKRIYKKDGIEVWKRPIMPVIDGKKSYVLLFVSRRNVRSTMVVTFSLKQLWISNSYKYHLKDLFSNANYGLLSVKDPVSIELGSTDLKMLKAEIIAK